MSNSIESLYRKHLASLARAFAVVLLAAAFVMLPNIARADSTATYDISGTTASGGVFDGSLEFDQNGSTLQLINTSFTLDGQSFVCNGATSNVCTVFDPFNMSFANIPGSGAVVVLNWLDSSFDIFNPPSSFDFISGYCIGCGAGGPDFVTSGTANFVAAPEPSSCMLLGIGLVAVSLISRRRLNNSLNRVE